MEIKDGDIITLANGSKATVSLTPIKEELKLNTWYKARQSYHNQLCFKVDDGGGYGFVNNGWSSCLMCSNPRDWVEASQQEVEQALIAEAKKRYGGKKAKCLHDCLEFDYTKNFDTLDLQEHCNVMRYYNNSNLTGSCGCIYAYGQWAEIQKSVLDQPSIAIKVNNKREFD